MIHWIANSFSIATFDLGSINVQGLTTTDGLLGMHFAHSRAIHLTHLGTGFRVHPEPGFADLRAAAEFAERILHLDWENAARFDKDTRLYLYTSYQAYALSRDS